MRHTAQAALSQGGNPPHVLSGTRAIEFTKPNNGFRLAYVRARQRKSRVSLIGPDRQQYGWLDLDRPRDGARVSDLGAAESGRREAAVAEMFGSRINGAMLIAAGAVDFRLEAEGGYLAERRER
jgi:hypothetical protein